ncbi:hypothetical protein, partial [Klebsiella quasivariicola]|uniref:hypothetical protein n=1 Tax=Klebsiella quasivariicola TaxID=2026240 RepID=UPI00247B1429
MVYGEGIAITGFYVALNEDNGTGMAGFSPEAVLRTLSGLRFCSPGKRSATGGDIPHTAKNPAPFGTGFLLKRKNKKLSLSTELSALFDAWQFPTLTWGDPTLPSALRRFTS